MLFIPRAGTQRLEDNQGTTSAEYGTSVSAGTPAHTKNATYTQLISALAYDAWGIFVGVHNTGVASTRTNVLVDIAIGAAASEVVIIPNLIAGNQGASGGAQGAGSHYFFPIRIASGSRISATAQASTASDTVHIDVHCLQFPIPGFWYGSRVTAYGALTASSSGTSMSPGSSTYATPVSLATTSYPIRYLQVGADLYTNTAGSNLRGLIKISIGNDAPIIVQDLPYDEGTTLETVRYTQANFILSHMLFNIPSGIDLRISAMRNATAATRGWALYGVD